MAFVLAINLSMELLISPENHKIIDEYGWAYFIQHQFFGIIIFYLLFNFVGVLVFLKTNYRPLRMGILSFVLGFIFEFTFMLPEWVQNIYALRITEDVIGAIIVSSLYWFIPWGLPSYVIHKYYPINNN